MIGRLNIFVLILILATACGQPSVESDQENLGLENHNSESSNQTETIPTELAAPERDAEQDSVDTHMSNLSPFLNQGCCLEIENREKDCCCKAVYEEYARLIQSADSRVAELSMTDPILADCRREMPKKFDELENPPTEETAEDIF